MSYRTIVELNHDYVPPKGDDNLLEWARKMRNYLGSGDKRDLPSGVTFKHIRHHSDPSPLAGLGDPS